MKIKALIVDLDGTILNTITTITHFVNKTLQKHNILPINEDECKMFIGDGARKLIARALNSKGINFAENQAENSMESGEKSSLKINEIQGKKADINLQKTSLQNNEENEKTNSEKRNESPREKGEINPSKAGIQSKEKDDEINFEEILNEYNAEYDSNPYYLTEKYSGADEFFEKIKAKGIKLAVISNKPHSITTSAVEHFYPDVFDCVFGGREGVLLKPSKDAIFCVLDALEVFADECAYLGDSNVDMQFGKAFGAGLTLGASWGFRGAEELLTNGADFVFDSFSDLAKFFENAPNL